MPRTHARAARRKCARGGEWWHRGPCPWRFLLRPVRSVLVVPANPRHREAEALLVPSLGGGVEQVIGAVQHVEATRVGRIGTVDRAVLAAAEGAEARRLLAVGRHRLV